MNDTTAIVINEESTELAKVIEPRSLISRETIELIKLMAPIYHQARTFGYTSEMQAAMVMLKAAGLGIPPTSAPDFFDVIDGRPALKPIAANALIQRSGIIKIRIEDGDDYCKITMKRLDNGFEHSVTYTDAEAMASNLIKPSKDNSAWQRFRVDMRFNRAFGRCAKRVAADILGGMPLTYELEELRSSRVQLPKPGECDHFAAVASDTACPACGEILN
jgi:hypothetical protein